MIHTIAPAFSSANLGFLTRGIQSEFKTRREATKMSIQKALRGGIAVCLFAALLAAGSDAGKLVSVNGYVLDSACAFTKDLKKPISAQCAQACARAGSPLVILGDNGTIYWPIADTTPSTGQNERLLPFAGQRVTASGKTYARGGSTAMVIEKIAAETAQK
jgi:hypothetical protein